MVSHARTLVFALAAVVVAACASNASLPDPAASAGPDAVTITAKDLQFDRATLSVPAGRPIQIVLDNLDGAPHNVAIYRDRSASAALFVGEIFAGPARLVYTVPALPAGSYYFRCDVHHDMSGTVEAR